MSQQYLLPCSCGEKLQVDSRQAGESITCKCGQRLTVPTLRGLRELQTVSDKKPSSIPARRAWSPLHGTLFSLGLATAVIAAGLAIRHFVAYSSLKPYVEDRTAEVDQYSNETIDSLSLEDSLEVWKSLTTTGLGYEGSPPWVAAQQQANYYYRITLVCLGVFAAGLAAAIAALLFSPRASGAPVRR